MDYYKKAYPAHHPFYKKLFWPLFLFIVAFVSWLFLITLTQKPKNQSFVSPLGISLSPIPTLTTTPTKPISNLLNTIVAPYLSQPGKAFAVAIKNLKTGEFYYSNEHIIMQTASLYKLWIMATVFEQIQKGALGEDQVLSNSVEVLNSKFNIDAEGAELTSGSITLSVKNALNRMISVSDNYAALLLTEKIGLARVANFLKANSFTDSSVGTAGGPPQSTAMDIASFFDKLYVGQLNEPKYTQEMLNLLKTQKKNNKLPNYLNDTVVIAHKTGELGTFSHDAGIVFTPAGAYIIVIMTDSPIPGNTEKDIAKLSKSVYDYFSQ